MKLTKYIGTFIAFDNQHTYTLEVHCSGFLQAFFLLTADAIRTGQHYQLKNIVNENGHERMIDDILKITNIFL